MRNKYNAKKVKLDGYTFDSKAEAHRYGELKLLLKNKKISDLDVHPKMPLYVAGRLVAKYIPDFSYCDNEKNNARVYEDVKGVRTSTYVLKKKLVKALYGIEIREIKA